jgi:hypothetical protein
VHSHRKTSQAYDGQTTGQTELQRNTHLAVQIAHAMVGDRQSRCIVEPSELRYDLHISTSISNPVQSNNAVELDVHRKYACVAQPGNAMMKPQELDRLTRKEVG